MDIATTLDDDVAARVATLVPWMQQRAAQLDAAAEFPVEEIAALHAAGALGLRLPAEAGVSPAEWSDAFADRVAVVLIQTGLGSLAVGTDR
jgi:alkylation response protein AidB-like acyl-CoA dehydrogenase